MIPRLRRRERLVEMQTGGLGGQTETLHQTQLDQLSFGRIDTLIHACRFGQQHRHRDDEVVFMLCRLPMFQAGQQCLD